MVHTKLSVLGLMDYLVTHPSSINCYHASNMVLHVDSDAAYLVAPNAKSRIAGYYYLSDLPSSTQPPHSALPVHIVCKFLKHVVASGEEAETAGLFHNGQEIVFLRCILIAIPNPTLHCKWTIQELQNLPIAPCA